MKVLFTFGGIPHYYARLLEKLQAKGVEVSVVIPKSDTSLSIGEGVKMSNSQLSFKIIRSDERLSGYKKACFPQLAAILQTEKPDILVCGWPYFLQFFFDRKLRKTIAEFNIRLMIKEIPFQIPPFGKLCRYYRKHPIYNEDMQLQSKGIGFYMRAIITMYIRCYCYRRVTATLNYCSSAYDVLLSYGVKKEQIFVTYNATDNESLWTDRKKIEQEPLLLLANNQRILHIGRLVKWKRVDLLIDAFAIICQKISNAELLIVGDGPEKANLMQQCNALQIADKVAFAGSIYGSYNLGKYMHEASIYVLAGMGGLSINDAMAYGLPIICSVCDGTEKDLVIDGYNGLYFKEGDAKDLSEKIMQLLSSLELQQQMGQHSEEIIRTKINLDSVTDNYINAFEYAMTQ